MTTTTDDVATTLGVSSPTDLQVSQWELWIGDATRAIDRWAERNGFTGLLNAADVDYVVREAVALARRRTATSRSPSMTARVRRYESGGRSRSYEVDLRPRDCDDQARSDPPTSADTYAARAERACGLHERRW